MEEKELDGFDGFIYFLAILDLHLIENQFLRFLIIKLNFCE